MPTEAVMTAQHTDRIDGGGRILRMAKVVSDSWQGKIAIGVALLWIGGMSSIGISYLIHKAISEPLMEEHRKLITVTLPAIERQLETIRVADSVKSDMMRETRASSAANTQLLLRIAEKIGIEENGK